MSEAGQGIDVGKNGYLYLDVAYLLLFFTLASWLCVRFEAIVAFEFCDRRGYSRYVVEC